MPPQAQRTVRLTFISRTLLEVWSGKPRVDRLQVRETSVDDLFDVFCDCVRAGHVQSSNWCQLFGHRIFERAFDDQWRALFDRTVKVYDEEDPCRILLAFDDDGEIHGTRPWEYMWIPDMHHQDKGHYWGARDWVTIARFIPSRQVELVEQAVAAAEDPKVKRPRVLVINGGYAGSQVSIAAVLGALKNRRIERDHVVVPEPSYVSKVGGLVALQELLQREARFDIVHFVGHGRFNGDGEIAVPKAVARDDRWLSTSEVVELLTTDKAKTPRLVVLQACDTGNPEYRKQGLTGMPAALVRAGVAAVVAMQFPIMQSVSDVFVKQFYGTLFDGAASHSVEAAVQAGRVALQAKDATRYAFGVPVLYIGNEREITFPKPAEEGSGHSVNTGSGEGGGPQ